MNKLPPYSLDAMCPKCGYEKIKTAYHAQPAYAQECYGKVKGEHLDRRCERCFYEWVEACLEEKQ